MPDLDALNDPDLLSDTPIGDLEVRVLWGQFVGVCIKGETKPGRCIHTLDPRGVLTAIYGKRTFEQASVRRLYQQQAEAEQTSAASHDEQRAHVLNSEMLRLIRRHGKADFLEAAARQGLVTG